MLSSVSFVNSFLVQFACGRVRLTPFNVSKRQHTFFHRIFQIAHLLVPATRVCAGDVYHSFRAMPKSPVSLSSPTYGPRYTYSKTSRDHSIPHTTIEALSCVAGTMVV